MREDIFCVLPIFGSFIVLLITSKHFYTFTFGCVVVSLQNISWKWGGEYCVGAQPLMRIHLITNPWFARGFYYSQNMEPASLTLSERWQLTYKACVSGSGSGWFGLEHVSLKVGSSLRRFMSCLKVGPGSGISLERTEFTFILSMIGSGSGLVNHLTRIQNTISTLMINYLTKPILKID